jgi:hypothetical protein
MRRWRASMSVNRRPSAGRTIVDVKTETLGFVGTEEMGCILVPAGGSLVRVLRRMVRMLWVWVKVRRVRVKVLRKV